MTRPRPRGIRGYSVPVPGPSASRIEAARLSLPRLALETPVAPRPDLLILCERARGGQVKPPQVLEVGADVAGVPGEVGSRRRREDRGAVAEVLGEQVLSPGRVGGGRDEPAA